MMNEIPSLLSLAVVLVKSCIAKVSPRLFHIVCVHILVCPFLNLNFVSNHQEH